jgi:hypothetical protein
MAWAIAWAGLGGCPGADMPQSNAADLDQS